MVCHSLKNVPKQCEIGTLILLTPFSPQLPTALPKDATTKLRSLKEMLTGTRILKDSETVFYICFLINFQTTNKQPPDRRLLISSFSFYLFTPTIDIEPFYINLYLILIGTSTLYYSSTGRTNLEQ